MINISDQNGLILDISDEFSLLGVNNFLLFQEQEEELEDLEQSLQALEKLDRSSPDLWPDQVCWLSYV